MNKNEALKHLPEENHLYTLGVFDPSPNNRRIPLQEAKVMTPLLVYVGEKPVEFRKLVNSVDRTLGLIAQGVTYLGGHCIKTADGIIMDKGQPSSNPSDNQFQTAMSNGIVPIYASHVSRKNSSKP